MGPWAGPNGYIPRPNLPSPTKTYPPSHQLKLIHRCNTRTSAFIKLIDRHIDLLHRAHINPHIVAIHRVAFLSMLGQGRWRTPYCARAMPQLRAELWFRVTQLKRLEKTTIGSPYSLELTRAVGFKVLMTHKGLISIKIKKGFLYWNVVID